jgi:hypothetical protein
MRSRRYSGIAWICDHLVHNTCQEVSFCMATYKVIPQSDQTFHVAIVGDDGARQTLLGFETRADALAWIARDRWQGVADNWRGQAIAELR